MVKLDPFSVIFFFFFLVILYGEFEKIEGRRLVVSEVFESLTSKELLSFDCKILTCNNDDEEDNCVPSGCSCVKNNCIAAGQPKGEGDQSENPDDEGDQSSIQDSGGQLEEGEGDQSAIQYDEGGQSAIHDDDEGDQSEIQDDDGVESTLQEDVDNPLLPPPPPGNQYNKPARRSKRKRGQSGPTKKYGGMQTLPWGVYKGW